MPSIAAGRLLGIEAAGLLHRATSTIQIYRKGVLEGLMPVLLPAFAAKLRQGHALKDSYLRGVAYLTAVGWPFSVVLALLAHPILRVLFGPQWDAAVPLVQILCLAGAIRSEEHTSELQSLMRISYAVFCLKKKTIDTIRTTSNLSRHVELI